MLADCGNQNSKSPADDLAQVKLTPAFHRRKVGLVVDWLAAELQDFRPDSGCFLDMCWTVLADPYIDAVDGFGAQITGFEQQMPMCMQPANSLLCRAYIARKLNHRMWYHASVFASLNHEDGKLRF